MHKNKRNIQKGMVSDSIVFILTIILSFAIIPIYLQFISMEELGIYLAVKGVVAVIALTDIGLTLYSTKKLSNDNFFNSSELIPYLNSAQIFQYILGLVLLLIGYIFYPYIDMILKVNTKFSEITNELFLFSWISIVVGAWFGLSHSILKSRHQLKFINISVFLIVLCSSILNIIFLTLGFNIVYFGISLLLATIVINLGIAYKVYIDYKIFLFYPKYFNKNDIKEGWEYVKQFQVLKIAQISKTSFFTTLLSAYGGQTIVAQYNITNKVAGMIPAFLSKIIGNMFPALSALFAAGNKKDIVKYYEKIFRIGIFVTFFSVVAIYTMNELFVTLWVGSDKFIGYEIFKFILLISVILTLNSFTGFIIHSSGEFKQLPMISILEIFVFIILSYILYQVYGLVGFFMGYTLSMLIGLGYSLFLINVILKVNVLKWALDELKDFMVVLASMLIVDGIVESIVKTSSFQFFIIVSSYLVIFTIVYFRRLRYA